MNLNTLIYACTLASIKERENEPLPKATLGDPPKHLTKDEKKCWRELVRTAPYGVIGDCDAWEVEIASCLMAEYRRSRLDMKAARLNLLHSIMGRFGFTPADRSRVQVPQPKEKNPFDDEDDEPVTKKRKLIPGTRILIPTD